MVSTLEPRTSPTLLEQLRQAPADQAAWGRFVDRYAPKIYNWSRRLGLQSEDAEDVTQDVLCKLAAAMRTFRYDPSASFRAWLKTLTHHAWYDFVRHRERAGRANGDSGFHQRQLATCAAREDLVHHLQEEFDQELLEEAMARVRLRIEPRTWEAFRLLALEGWPGTRAAARLGMRVAAVFMARSNVQKLLQEEVRKLEGAGAG
jgi:RNA polymerase sigma-70 factor (ECF subfamily)